MAKLSGELINTLNLLPNTELFEVQNYISSLIRERSKQEAENFKNKLQSLVEEANKKGIYFTTYCSNCGEIMEISIDTIEDLEVRY